MPTREDSLLRSEIDRLASTGTGQPARHSPSVVNGHTWLPLRGCVCGAPGALTSTAHVSPPTPRQHSQLSDSKSQSKEARNGSYLQVDKVQVGDAYRPWLETQVATLQRTPFHD